MRQCQLLADFTQFLPSQIKFSIFSFSSTCHVKPLNRYFHLSLPTPRQSWSPDGLLLVSPILFRFCFLSWYLVWNLHEKSVFKTSISIPTLTHNLLIICTIYCGLRIVFFHIFIQWFFLGGEFQTLVNILHLLFSLVNMGLNIIFLKGFVYAY